MKRSIDFQRGLSMYNKRIKTVIVALLLLLWPILAWVIGTLIQSYYNYEVPIDDYKLLGTRTGISDTMVLESLHWGLEGRPMTHIINESDDKDAMCRALGIEAWNENEETVLLTYEKEVEKIVLEPSFKVSSYMGSSKNVQDLSVCKPYLRDGKKDTIYIYIIFQNNLVCEYEHEFVFF